MIVQNGKNALLGKLGENSAWVSCSQPSAMWVVLGLAAY